MPKPRTHITKTLGPIHFEDLDPHRFEDLVRELIYDYKDWQSIEATGRSGSDGGFDVRAYEKVTATTDSLNEESGEADIPHPMEGNLWMIQGKREKEIGPKRIKSILTDIDQENPPYGYILAASANFSKQSYDAFREELRKRGVMEFYLWGKAELEDMLHLPKNDRILFTFFGVSLVSKRRSRATEVRSTVTTKNKLVRVLGEGRDFHQPILLRDLKDIHYPYEGQYPDFEKNPRWQEFPAVGHHPLGIRVHAREYFAYVDTQKKEWDFTSEVDLVQRQVEEPDDNAQKWAKRQLVQAIWEFFPHANQAYLKIEGLVQYADIAIVDDEGDVLYPFPHLYVDFGGKDGPYSGFFEEFKIGNREISRTDDYKRIPIFPKTFKPLKPGRVLTDKPITLDPKTLEDLKGYRGVDALFETDGRYADLKPHDILAIAGYTETSDTYVQVTHKISTTVKEYIAGHDGGFRMRDSIQQQLQREPKDEEMVNVVEFRKFYKRQLEERSK